jgi:hypothetical protein
MFKPETTVVAVDGGVVGFGLHVPFSEFQGPYNLSNCLLYSRDPARYRPNLKRILTEQGLLKNEGDFVFEGFDTSDEYDNVFTRGNFGLNSKDTAFDGVAVLKKRRGIGRQLTEERIKKSEQRGSRAIYALCMDGGDRAPYHMYTDLGFLPILRFGPSYPDPCIVMIRSISEDTSWTYAA